MNRPLLNLLTALSLLFLLATAALWVRSYWREDELDCPTYIERIDSERGAVIFQWQIGMPWFEDSRWLWNSYASPKWPPIYARTPQASVFGAQRGTSVLHSSLFGTPRTKYYHQYLLVPYWVFCLLASPLPATWLLRRLRSRPHQTGLCPHCSYDLRAHQPNSELRTQNSELPPRCPECATPITAGAKT